MFTVPDKGEGQNDIQSILFQEFLEVLVAGIDGKDCVLSGLAVTAQGSPDMTVAVAKGAVLSNGTMYAVAAANGTITTADSTNPRIDLVVITSAGAIAVRAGTAAAAPKPPTRTANDVVIAAVWVPASDTTISSTQITDMRVMRTQGPIVIKKVTSPVTINTSNAKSTLLSVTVPNGLFLAGKVIRVRMGGNMLANSGTPTFTFTVDYGGTTTFADATAASATSAVRHAWYAEFDLTAQANNDQAIVGWIEIQQWATAVTAPTSGIAGEIGGTTAATAQIVSSFTGSAAVDSDAANRDLVVSSTFNVSNAADEIVMEYATVELL